MAINKRTRLTSSSLHFPNDLAKPEGKDESTSGKKLENHQAAAGDLLFDPKDAEGGNTHSDKPLKVVAAVEEDEDLDLESVDDAMPAETTEEVEVEEVEAADEGVSDTVFDEEETEDADEVLEEELDEDEEAVEAEIEDLDEDLADESSEELVEELVDESEEVEAEQLCGEDGVPLVDVDQTDDTVEDTDDLGFASIGASLHCIKANRIIATMTKKAAITADKADIYQGDEFPFVVAAEVQSKGLRKGLLAAGFILAKVDVESNKAVKAAVAKELVSAKTKLQASNGKSQEAFQQCMAIAAVGINRNFFKNSKNTLKAALEEELAQAGVRGGAKLVRAAFAQYGIDYAHSLIAMANKLVAMPEETRNQFADALDMTDNLSDDEEEVEEDIEDFDPDMDQDDEIPASVTAALSKPIRSTRVVASSRTQKSIAQEILSGTKPLHFV